MLWGLLSCGSNGMVSCSMGVFYAIFHICQGHNGRMGNMLSVAKGCSYHKPRHYCLHSHTWCIVRLRLGVVVCSLVRSISFLMVCLSGSTCHSCCSGILCNCLFPCRLLWSWFHPILCSVCDLFDFNISQYANSFVFEY